MGKAAGSIMFLSSDSGEVSSMRRFISSHQTMGWNYMEKLNGIWSFTIPAGLINPWGITYRKRYMYRPHKFPFPANWPGKEIKRIFERMLSEGGEYF